MGLLLEGLTVLMIGDSHLTTPGYLVSTLQDDLTKKGAMVTTYGACGLSAGKFVTKTPAPCGASFRKQNERMKIFLGPDAFSEPVGDLLKEQKPNLIVVVLGDTMGGYNQPSIAKNWVWQEVSALTKVIKNSGTSCVWIGPAWGEEGGKYGKTFTRVKQFSGYLSELVAPCHYIDSLQLSKPGEWKTTDGQHFDWTGYQKWGQALGELIASPEMLQKINFKPQQP